MTSILKVTKGHNSVKFVGRVTVLVLLCILSDDVFYFLYQVL